MQLLVTIGPKNVCALYPKQTIYMIRKILTCVTITVLLQSCIVSHTTVKNAPPGQVKKGNRK
jgi:hypothetical protein